MTSRERVLTALAHEEPDRVPLALWGSSYGLTDLAYRALLEYLQLPASVPPFRQSAKHTVSYYDDRVLECLGTDLRHVWLGSCDALAPRGDGLRDGWGVGWQGAGGFSPVHHPLATAALADLDELSWPTPERVVRLDALRARLEAVKAQGDYAIAARAIYSYGPFELSCQLRGTERLLMDMVLDPDFVDALTDKIARTMGRLLDIYLDVVAGEIDLMELPGDDLAGDRGPLISPAFFRRFYKPFWAAMVASVKARQPGCRVVFHSDGAITPFLDDLVDVGIDAVTPLQPLPVTDTAAVKARYGRRLAFIGAIDIREALPGTLQSLEAEVRQRIQQLGPGGGYVLAPANHVQPDVPAQNVVHLYRLARRYGKYPLERILCRE